MSKINNIWRQIFDVRPVKDTGELDLGALKEMRQVINLRGMAGYKYYLRELEAYFSAERTSQNVAKNDSPDFLEQEYKVPIKSKTRGNQNYESGRKIGVFSPKQGINRRKEIKTLEVSAQNQIFSAPEVRDIPHREELIKELEFYINPNLSGFKKPETTIRKAENNFLRNDYLPFPRQADSSGPAIAEGAVSKRDRENFVPNKVKLHGFTAVVPVATVRCSVGRNPALKALRADYLSTALVHSALRRQSYGASAIEVSSATKAGRPGLSSARVKALKSEILGEGDLSESKVFAEDPPANASIALQAGLHLARLAAASGEPRRWREVQTKRAEVASATQAGQIPWSSAKADKFIPYESRRRDVAPIKFSKKRFFIPFLITVGVIIFLAFGLLRIRDFASKKGEFMSLAQRARENLAFAQQSILKNDFSSAELGFTEAYNDFAKINGEIKNLSNGVVNIFNYIPLNNKISSISHLLRGGENITLAGRLIAEAIQPISNIKFEDLWGEKEPPFTEILSLARDKLLRSNQILSSAIEEFKKVDANDLPPEIKTQVELLQEKLPVIKSGAEKLLNFSDLFLNILGRNNSRKYLLVFENSSEIRATGGFIGTYGLLEIDRGQIKNVFIDGIFNADGQLHEKIIPPQPIQKISTAWSMHDANWFADFPTSAEKIAWFYEKTGGPTVDGVIAFTPFTIEKILEITGPISMPEYGAEVNSDNFVETTQYEVEVDYDKRLNQPKKFISDLFPKIIEKIKGLPPSEWPKILDIFQQSFSQKQILVYFFNKDEQNFVLEKGWGGEIKATDGDYLSVVSSNINGYKTDKMIDEKINYQAEIASDGSIINTITITRKHLGGKEKYDWWNKVNSDYLRVYVPQGSELLEARGHTLEKYAPPIDYEKQGFKKDSLVERIESTLKIDETGTQIFEESGKTVFGNWVYVSPGKTVEVVYKYKLPFKIDPAKSSSNYSLLTQKQSGSEGSEFNFSLKIPDGWRIVWKYPEKLEQDSSIRPLAAKLSDKLDIDRFYGVAIESR